MEDPSILLEKYSKEIEEDTYIDLTNIMEKQLSSPNVKHKWLFRLTKAKKNLIDLIDGRETFLSDKIEADNPIGLSKSAMKDKASKNSNYRALQKKIKEQELLIEFLESAVNKIFAQMGFDFKNLVELMKMEQL